MQRPEGVSNDAFAGFFAVSARVIVDRLEMCPKLVRAVPPLAPTRGRMSFAASTAKRARNHFLRPRVPARGLQLIGESPAEIALIALIPLRPVGP